MSYIQISLSMSADVFGVVAGLVCGLEFESGVRGVELISEMILDTLAQLVAGGGGVLEGGVDYDVRLERAVIFVEFPDVEVVEVGYAADTLNRVLEFFQGQIRRTALHQDRGGPPQQAE